MTKATTDLVSESPVVSPWLGGVGDPCGWGFWHLWLQLAQVFYLSFQKQACHTRVDPNQKFFVCRNRCPKGHSCAQDVPNDGPHHKIPVLLLLRIPKGKSLLVFLSCITHCFRRSNMNPCLQVFQQYAGILQQKYPDLSIRGDNFPPGGFRLQTAQILSVIKFLVIMMVLARCDLPIIQSESVSNQT